MMRRLRLFLIVTVAVLVAGTGLTSASALWSQRADVAATVTTGTWVVQDGTWHPAPTFTVSDIDRGLVWTSFTVTWTVPDREVTAYSLDVSGIGTDVRHNPAQNSARVTFPTTSPTG